MLKVFYQLLSHMSPTSRASRLFTLPRTLFCFQSPFWCNCTNLSTHQECLSISGSLFCYFQNVTKPLSECRIAVDNRGATTRGMELWGRPCWTWPCYFSLSQPQFSHLWNDKSWCTGLRKCQRITWSSVCGRWAMPVQMPFPFLLATELILWICLKELTMGSTLFAKSEEYELL